MYATQEIKMVILASHEDRVKLLRAGFTGRQIETIYILLNSFEIVGVDWQEETK